MDSSNDQVAKARIGIKGLDDITGGGFPRGRSTLLCGQAGTGKTLLALEFIARGALLQDEPGVFLTFEENTDDMLVNAASLGLDLPSLIAQQRLEIEHVRLERSEVGGSYDLGGLFIRIEAALDKIKAQRLALDSLDSLFLSLADPTLVRAEMRRLVQWLKDHNVTVVITVESGVNSLTRHAIEEYVSDCVIVLDNRIVRLCATRVLRIVKYRGCAHGADEYPFLIGPAGISLQPLTSLELNPPVSDERISSGIADLDTMLGGRGYYRGSSVLISGTPGSGKSTVAAKFAMACCERGERCLYFLLEESPDQFIRNMRSVGIDLHSAQQRKLLRLMSTPPTLYGFEARLTTFQQVITEFEPHAVVFDPISTLYGIEDMLPLKLLLVRLLNFVRTRQITSHVVSLVGLDPGHLIEADLNSMVDSSIQLLNIESEGERNRVISVLKSRGMAHSNQVRKFRLSEHGVQLCAVVPGPDGILIGSARVAWQGVQESVALAVRQEKLRLSAELERERRLKDEQIAAIEAGFAARLAELERRMDRDIARARQEVEAMQNTLRGRGIDPGTQGAGATAPV